MNKKMYQAALLVALGLASVTAAQALVIYNNDLMVGFTTQSGTDLVYDLGSESSLYGGETWDLTAALTAAGLDGSLSSVQWGVVGDANVSSARTSWLTVASGTPNSVPSRTAFNVIDSADAAIYQGALSTAGMGNYGTPDTTVSYSWNTTTTTVAGLFYAASQNPNVTGLTAANFWQQVADGSAPTQVGTFSLGGDSVLTYAPVPEPTSMALMAVGGGFLMLVGRNKLGRKQS